MDCTARFAALVGGPDRAIPLDETALLIAAHDHDVDIDRQLHRLDDVAAAVREPTIDELRRVLFVQHGLAGAADDYYAPENSFLDTVLDRGRGIPITLAVLMMEVGRRVGVAVHGIGAPGHFLVQHDDELRDPFDGGRVVEGEGIHPSYLAPIGPRALLGRMLANLRQIYQTAGEFTSLLWVMRLRCAIPDVPDSDHEQLARMEASLN
jgi:regulator of sirC expression with transglutaminase-like and TPR domain